MAADGREGLTRLSECHPDLVLLDMMMPELDGLAMLKIMRDEAEYRTIPVILVTGSQRPDGSLGFDDYLAKPFNIDTLLAKVARQIGPGERGGS